MNVKQEGRVLMIFSKRTSWMGESLLGPDRVIFLFCSIANPIDLVGLLLIKQERKLLINVTMQWRAGGDKFICSKPPGLPHNWLNMSNLTQNLFSNKSLQISELLKGHIPNLFVVNTMCYKTLVERLDITFPLLWLMLF